MRSSYVRACVMLGGVQVRSPGLPDDEAAAPTLRSPTPARTPGVVVFRVPTQVVAAKIALAVLLVVLAVLGQDAVTQVIGLAAAAGVAAYALRDLLAPERVRADQEAVTVVSGYASRRRLSWSEIERVRVDSRPRFGVHSVLLELDAGDAIYLFSRSDLGADPHDAMEMLDELRGGHGTLGERDTSVTGTSPD